MCYNMKTCRFLKLFACVCFCLYTWTVLCTSYAVSLQVLQESDIFSLIKSSCVIGASEYANDVTLQQLQRLAEILEQEPNVAVGIVDTADGRWHNGKTLKLKERVSFDRNNQVLLFRKLKVDRNCLLTPNIGHVLPAADIYSGPYLAESFLQFVNQHCGTFRTMSGTVSIAGLHRESILSNLFHVKDISNITMKKLWVKKIESETETTSSESKLPKSCKLADSNEIKQNDDSYNCLPVKDNMYINVGSDHKVQSIPQCEKINTLTKDEFFHNYLKLSKPVIIQNAARNWTALKKWTNEFLFSKFGNEEVHIKIAPKGNFEGVEKAAIWEDFNTFQIPKAVGEQLLFPDLVVVRPATMNVNFSDFIAFINQTSHSKDNSVSSYLEYSSIPQYFAALEEDIQELPFTQNLLSRRHLNIWLSDGNTLGKLHFDPFDNLLCQISGKKEITLFEPHDNHQLYEAHIPEAILDYNKTSKQFQRKRLLDSTAMVMAPVDILNPDFKRFPEFANTHPLNCTIAEGDVLFMPAFWWHEVQSYPDKPLGGRNLAVNFWYEPFLTKDFPCQECKLDINPHYYHLLG